MGNIGDVEKGNIATLVDQRTHNLSLEEGHILGEQARQQAPTERCQN